MSAVDNAFFDLAHPSPDYRDFRALADDKKVLRNPHKGWYWHYIDNGYGRDNYRAAHDPADHCEDFPGLNHLYLRFDWGDIEKREGVYDWSYIDAIMEEWSRYDYRFAFRICTYEGDGSVESLKFATPKWVFDAGAQYTLCANGAYEPDYGDPIYLDKLERFMRAYGEKFNRDPRVELIDIGAFGTWGEGHTGNGSGKVWPVEVMQRHIDLHVKNFPDKPVLLNDDFINHRGKVRPLRENRALLEYAAREGCGARDDSVCVEYYSRTCGYNTLRTPFLFDHFWKQAPVDLEFEHYANVLSRPDDFQDGLPFLDALQRTHATYAGFHGYPRPWLQKMPYLTAYLANRLGYWYFLDGMELPVLHNGDNALAFYVTNRGFAHCYTRYTAKVCLIDTAGVAYEHVLPSLDNRRWENGQTTVERTNLPLQGMTPGDYLLCFGLFEGDRPIELGMRDLYREDNGFYRLAKAVIR